MYLYGAYTPSLVVVVVLLTCHLAGAGEPPKGKHTANSVDTNGKQLDLVMPGARPETDDSYLCSAFDVEALSGTKEAVHITGFVPDADANRAHHMLLYTCNQPNELPGKVYDCMHHAMCKDANSIMFAWAKNAPPTTLPKNVGFKMDPKERKYLVLQVHYAHPLPDADNTGLSLKYQMTPPTYQAGILLMVTGGQIAPHEEKVHLDINCKLPAEVPLHFFGFRTHAHSLGSVISGYAFNEKSNEYRQIAKGSPQWPQAFYPMKQLQTVKPGEYLAARCTYNSTTRDKVTFIGATAGDEMCNLYMMYFFPPGKAADYLGCGGVQAGNEITEGLPAGNDVAPPRNEVWEAKAHNSGVDTGVTAINYDDLMDTQALMDNKGSTKKAGIEEEDQMAIYNFTMIGAKPTQTDDYLCTALKMKGMSTRKLWIERFSAIANGNRAHHMILSKCKHPIKEDDSIYDCRHHAMCLDQSKIMFAWAKHAEPTKLPPDVGFDIADDDFLVLQVHYAEPLNDPDYSGLQLQFTTREPKYTAGIFLLGRSNLYIPPNTPTTHGDANCKANIPAWIHVFAYRTHAHSFGNVISGYKKGKTGEWSLIAKGNPQWPQAFYPMEKEMIIAPGDTVAARCSYNTTGHDSPVKIGATAGDEMCNLYLMYYTTSKDTEFVVCFDEKDTELNKHLPQGNDEPLPPNPELEMKAHGTTEAAQTNPTTGIKSKLRVLNNLLTNGDGDIYTNMLTFGDGIPRYNRFVRKQKRQIDGMGRYDPSPGNGGYGGPVAGGFMSQGYQTGGGFNPGVYMPNMGGLQPQAGMYPVGNGAGGLYPSQQQIPQYPVQMPPQQMLPQQYQDQQIQQQQAVGGGGGNGLQGHWPQLPDPQDVGIGLDDGGESQGDENQQSEEGMDNEQMDENEDNNAPETAEEKDTAATTKQSKEAKTKSRKKTGREGKSLPGSHYSLVPGWPAKETASYLGQVSGVAIDTYGNAVIFHRGDRTWNGNTFKSDNTYGMDKNVPIPQDTVLTVNSTGHIINQWGNNFFFLPHMITIDKQNNVWVTDVAMHQVFKFGPYGGDDKKPLLTLGTKFEPGTDDSHYCKPTSVAVSADTKTFYVSDGYCNSRIIKYSITVTSDGKHAVNKITEWGKTAGVMSISRGPYNFNIPHSLTLAEDKNLICVADRENGRVLCFDTDGNAKKEIQPEGFGGRIFGISYAKQQLYAVSGPEFNPFAPKPVGFILDVESGQIDGTFQVPDGLKNPHDVVVSEDASTIYVVELNPFVTWKLSNGQPSALSGSSSVSSGLPAAGKQPTAAGSSSPQQMILDGAKKLVPTSSGVLWAAVISVPLTILVSCLLAIRKCRKRGKGTMTDGGSRPKNWGLGDILGRSKDGFQPVNTEERDGLVGDDSDSEVEEFSVPAMHA